MLARIVTEDWVSGGHHRRQPAPHPDLGADSAGPRSRMDRQWRLLSRLSALPDVVAGLPTLKVFGRAGRAGRIDQTHHRYTGSDPRRCGSPSCRPSR
ncbi:hypothetical protein LV779_38045 [Streptomyces thinghirensis]|nr:hypothetical protein [Streptomyces thinghirensis]